MYEPWGSSIQRAWFSSWYVVSIDTGCLAQSPQFGPRWSPASKDGACSVCFLLHSRLLTLLTHSMIVIYRDIMHPASPTSDLGERHQPMCYKVQIHCKIQGAQSRTIKTTIPMVNIVFHQIPFTQDRTEVQKGRLSSDITFT